MNTSFLQPKNALQRAEELCSVGQELEAFELLQKTILDRKFRYLQWDALAQQEVVMQFLTLAVKLDRIKQCRDGLLNYRNHCQHGVSMLGPLEKVIVYFRTCAETRVEQSLGTPVELESALRICVETYRTIIDVIKNTHKLSKLYHSTVHRAHELCRKYGLRNDFRRLADLIRTNYTIIMKQKPRPDADAQLIESIEELKRPENHIETKLSQLETAVALDAWKEAQLSIEELFQLGILDLATLRGKKQTFTPQQKALLLQCVSHYFQYASEFFRKAGFEALHALALSRWLMQVRVQNKSLSEESVAVLSSLAVIATLAVPIELKKSNTLLRSPKDEEERRLAGLIGHGCVLTRNQLIQLIIDKQIYDNALPSVQRLFDEIERAECNAMNVTHLFKDISADFSGVDAAIHSDAHSYTLLGQEAQLLSSLSQYFVNIRRSVLRRGVMNVAQIYECLSLERFKTQFCPPEFMTWRQAEREIAAAERACGIDIKFDFAGKVIRLNSRQTSDTHLESRRRMAQLSSQLYRTILHHKQPLSDRSKLMKEIRAKSEVEQATWQQRLALIEKKRDELANLQRHLSQGRADADRERAQKAADAEAAKTQAVAAELEASRRRREIENARLQCAAMTIEKMNQVVKSIGGVKPQAFKVNGLVLSDLTPEIVVTQKISFTHFADAVAAVTNAQVAQAQKLARQEYKKHDYLARAIRLEKVKLARKLEASQNEDIESWRTDAETALDHIRTHLAKRNELLTQKKDQVLAYIQSF